MIVYQIVKAVCFVLYKLFFRFSSHGSDEVPNDSRGVILAPNHASYLDPPLLGISLKRRVTYLAKDYLFKAFFVGWILRSVEALPIKSEADDFKSIRQLLKALKDGKCIVVFPEGTRSFTGELQPAEQGVGFLAAKSAAWVVPVYISGTYEAYPKGAKGFKCAKVSVRYGKAFIPAEDKNLMAQANPYQATADRIMEDIKRLKFDSETIR